MVRDLAEAAVRMVKQEKLEAVQDKAKEMAEERILDIFVPEPKEKSVSNPLNALFGGSKDEDAEEKPVEEPKYSAGREWCRKRLQKGELENEKKRIYLNRIISRDYYSRNYWINCCTNGE